MMLRSSSTPVLGSLLSSISPENPNHHHHDTTLTPHRTSPLHRFSLSPGSQRFTTLSCSSSPISPSFSNGGIRRAHSEGNLESLMNCTAACGDDEFSFVNPPKKFSSRQVHCSLLESIPSFSYENSRFKSDDDESGDEEEQEEETVVPPEQVSEFEGFNMENKVMKLNRQLGFENSGTSPLCLARGIEVDVGFGGGNGGGGGGGINLTQVGHGGGGGDDNRDVEEHYKKMVHDNPGNPLFLRNYAQFLYQSNKDLEGAEEYYSRAILVDPNDGEILSQYARIVWELHRDKERATGYFERAVNVASEDSHVHAAYASFLWETEGEEEDDDEGYYGKITPVFNNGTMASLTA